MKTELLKSTTTVFNQSPNGNKLIDLQYISRLLNWRLIGEKLVHGD